MSLSTDKVTISRNNLLKLWSFTNRVKPDTIDGRKVRNKLGFEIGIISKENYIYTRDKLNKLSK